jgi:Tol biopolymer transport system component
MQRTDMQATDMQATLIPLEDFFSDPVSSGASLSPDGTRIAYLAPKDGRRNVWVRGTDEEHSDAVPSRSSSDPTP